MKNLENNKIYKSGQLALFSISVMSILLMVIRLIAPDLARKAQFISPYSVWRFFDVGLSSYLENPTTNILVRLIISCAVLLGIYIACLLLSKKSLWFMVGALFYFLIDTTLFAYETAAQGWWKMLIVGLAFKLILIITMIIAIIYGFIGKRIENSEASEVPDIKFLDRELYDELSAQKRTVQFERNKSFVNSHIYLQLILDGKTVCYLKDGETQEIEIDANKHALVVLSHFANIKPIKRIILVGNENNSYTIKIERKFLIFKSMEIYKNL